MEEGRYDGRARQSEVYTLQTLPMDIILEIVGRVARKSVRDVFNLRLSCKFFDMVGKHASVLERMEIAKLDKLGISLISASRNNSHARSFFTQCINACNPKAIFQQGMVKVFTECDNEGGIQVLLRASELGHDVASYACDIVMYCWGSEEDKGKGFALINRVKQKVGYKIFLYRIRLSFVLESVLVSRRLLFIWKRNKCANIANGTSLRRCRRSCPWKAI